MFGDFCHFPNDFIKFVFNTIDYGPGMHKFTKMWRIDQVSFPKLVQKLRWLNDPPTRGEYLTRGVIVSQDVGNLGFVTFDKGAPCPVFISPHSRRVSYSRCHRVPGCGQPWICDFWQRCTLSCIHIPSLEESILLEVSSCPRMWATLDVWLLTKVHLVLYLYPVTRGVLMCQDVDNLDVGLIAKVNLPDSTRPTG